MVRRIRDRVMAKHKIRVAEIGGQDTWQRVELGFAVVGSDGQICEQSADRIVEFIDDLDLGRRIDLQRDRLTFGENRGHQLEQDDWMPDFTAGDGT